MRMRTLARDERAVTLVEYALLIALAVLVIITAMRYFSDSFINATNYIANKIDTAVNGS